MGQPKTLALHRPHIMRSPAEAVEGWVGLAGALTIFLCLTAVLIWMTIVGYGSGMTGSGLAINVGAAFLTFMMYCGFVLPFVAAPLAALMFALLAVASLAARKPEAEILAGEAAAEREWLEAG